MRLCGLSCWDFRVSLFAGGSNVRYFVAGSFVHACVLGLFGIVYV